MIRFLSLLVVNYNRTGLQNGTGQREPLTAAKVYCCNVSAEGMFYYCCLWALVVMKDEGRQCALLFKMHQRTSHAPATAADAICAAAGTLQRSPSKAAAAGHA